MRKLCCGLSPDPPSGRKPIEPKNKEGPRGALFFTNGNWVRSSDPDHVLGLQALWSLLHLKLHLRAFIQRAIPVRLDSRKMDENIVAGGPLDKSITLGGVKPLHYTSFLHYTFS
jgi:hypothetical protein